MFILFDGKFIDFYCGQSARRLIKPGLSRRICGEKIRSASGFNDGLICRQLCFLPFEA
jgi:hypothetical protein